MIKESIGAYQIPRSSQGYTRSPASAEKRLRRKLFIFMLTPLIVCSCALPSVVQRQTVEYNTAAAAMANQLALMNIIRAKERLPIFYTSISRLSGSTVITATGGFNAAFKTASPTDTESLTTAPATTIGSTTTTPPAAPVGAATSTAAVNSVTTTVTNLASHAVTSGGNLFTPSIGGQVVSGPSFDINILDTQQFYQGILAEVPFSTIELFINQGIDNGLLMRLLIERIEYRRHDTGEFDHTSYNSVSGGNAKQFLKDIACFKLIGDSPTKPDPIAPISRVTSADDGVKKFFSLKDLALLDGQKFTLAKMVGTEFKTDQVFIPSTTDEDSKIYVVRPAPDKRLPRLVRKSPCVVPTPLKLDGTAEAASDKVASDEATRAISDVLSNINDTVLKSVRSSATITFKGNPAQVAPPGTALDAIVYFRSPEGIIRFLGNYLSAISAARASKEDPTDVYAVDGGALFWVTEGRTSDPLVSTSVLGTSYSIKKDGHMETSMTVLALVEELVNLQKSATDRPVTVPVHVLQ
jgi:hypothetical protein